MEEQGQEVNTIAQAAEAPTAVAPTAPAKNPAIEGLKPGETLLVKARGVKGDKVELEFAEHVKNPNNTGSSNPLVGLLNKSDARFSAQGGPRRGWVTGTKTDISALLGIDVSTLTLGMELPFNKINPTINGMRLRLQVMETTIADAYQAENIDTQAKRRGKDGDYILHEGMYIFANVKVIPFTGEVVPHVFLDADRAPEATGIKAIATQVAQTATDGLAV